MTSELLPAYKDWLIAITLDAREALAVLSFSPEGRAMITTLCFVSPGPECPMVQHELSEAEIASLELDNSKRFKSRIVLKSKKQHALPA